MNAPSMSLQVLIAIVDAVTSATEDTTDPATHDEVIEQTRNRADDEVGDVLDVVTFNVLDAAWGDA